MTADGTMKVQLGFKRGQMTADGTMEVQFGFKRGTDDS